MSVTHTNTLPQTLKQVRDLFIRTSGRDDLVNADGSDYGANEYINRGARFLAARHPRISSRVKDLASGATRFSMEGNQSVLSVWVTNADGKFKLKRLLLNEWRETYSTIMNDMDTTVTPPIVTLSLGAGRPAHYCIAQGGLADQDNFSDSDTWADGDDVTWDYEDVTPGDHHNTKVILLAPIPDEIYTLRVFGHFYPKILEDDGDMNFWTMMQPQTLVKAAAYEAECDNRNTAGQRDALAALNEDLWNLHFNDVHEEMADLDRIKLS